MLNINFPYNPATILLGIHLGEMRTHVHTEVEMENRNKLTETENKPVVLKWEWIGCGQIRGMGLTETKYYVHSR